MAKIFLLLGRLEGSSFLLLMFLAMPLKYYAAWPLGVKILGPVHGFLFLLYCAWALCTAVLQKWHWKKHLLAYAAAIFPFGTFWFEWAYFPTKLGRSKMVNTAV
jgi:integral membrane protein